jgi:hypothetical protein
VAKKKEIEPQKLALDSLNAIIMDNKAMIHQSRANIEENRLLILSNQSAAALGNQQLANHKTEEIFESRKTVLVTFEPESQLQKDFIEVASRRSELDFLLHSARLNERCLMINNKMVEANSMLIAITDEIMQLNQEILEFNEENLDSNNELIHGVLNPLVVEEGMVEELHSENDSSFGELERLSSKNRSEITRILEQSANNKEIAIRHNGEIKDRREKLYANRQGVKSMRSNVGREVDYADIFLTADDEQE